MVPSPSRSKLHSLGFQYLSNANTVVRGRWLGSSTWHLRGPPEGWETGKNLGHATHRRGCVDPPFVRSCLDFWTRNPKVGHVCIWLLLMLRSFHGRVLTHRRTLWCSKEMCFVQDSYCPQSPVTLRQQLAPVQIRWKRTYMASFGVNSRSDHENSQPHCEILATMWEQPGFLWLNAVSQKSISHR